MLSKVARHQVGIGVQQLVISGVDLAKQGRRAFKRDGKHASYNLFMGNLWRNVLQCSTTVGRSEAANTLVTPRIHDEHRNTINDAIRHMRRKQMDLNKRG